MATERFAPIQPAGLLRKRAGNARASRRDTREQTHSRAPEGAQWGSQPDSAKRSLPIRTGLPGSFVRRLRELPAPSGGIPPDRLPGYPRLAGNRLSDAGSGNPNTRDPKKPGSPTISRIQPLPCNERL